MSPLSEEEKKTIIEEERIRADERAKYAQPQPQQVVVKEKRSFGCGSLFLVLIIIGVVVSLVLTALGDARDKARKAREQAAVSSLPPVTPPVNKEESAPLGIKRDAVVSHFKKLGFTIAASENAKDIYVGRTPEGGAKGYNVLQIAGPAANLDRMFITGVERSNFALSNPTLGNVVSFAEFFGGDSKVWVIEQLTKISTNPSSEQNAVKVFNNKKFDYSYNPSAYGIYLEVTGVK
jgi:hypothetical protein